MSKEIKYALKHKETGKLLGYSVTSNDGGKEEGWPCINTQEHHTFLGHQDVPVMIRH
jgi:hypothetical protein